MVLLQPVTNDIDIALEQSVQKKPEGLLRFGGFTDRGPILPPYGSRERERALRTFWHHDYNTKFRGAIAGLTKRIQSTPWEVSSNSEDAGQWQAMLQLADFGSWDRFLAKLITDYSRQDGGAYIELIGPGHPLDPIQGAVTNIAILDSLRCWPTGDPTYPIVYMNLVGEMHTLHRTRVVQFVDMPESDDYHIGYGDCALSRAIAPVSREILMGRYIEQLLDDNPPPGFVLFKNLSDKQLEAQVERWQQDRSTDSRGLWGRNIRLYGLQTENAPGIEYVTFNQAPANFDYEKYTTINVREIALSIGVDIQDMWELTGGGIGTGTQSEVLAAKSKGKALGRILKGLERVINQVLPDHAEFTFKYADTDEDEQRAAIAEKWASIVTILETKLTPQEQRQLLANQVEAIADVITDQSGHVRLNDADPQTEAQQQPATAPNELPAAPEEMVNDTKAIQDTRQRFVDAFTQIVNFARMGIVGKGAVEMALNAQLQQAGNAAYSDGLVAGNAEPGLTAKSRQVISAWRTKQRTYVRKFAGELFESEWDAAEIRQRATLWVNMSINPLYYDGLAEAAPQRRYMWVVDATKEHCVTCLRLNGQIHRMNVYVERGLVPQSRALVCSGYNCGCTLRATTEPARGRLRSVPYVRGRRERRIERAA